MVENEVHENFCNILDDCGSIVPHCTSANALETMNLWRRQLQAWPIAALALGLVASARAEEVRLAIERTGARAARIAWPSAASNYTLQSSGSLAGPWVELPGPHTVDGDRLVLDVSAIDQGRFYRLRTNDPPPLLASGWPQWRGPNRDGISPEAGLLKEWPQAGPALAWQASGLGAGYSSVAIGPGLAITMGGFADSTRVIALAADTGQRKWSRAVGGPGVRGGRPNPCCTPTVAKDFVFVLTQQGNLACLETATGTVVWQKDLVAGFGGQLMGPQFGYCESPVADGDRLVCTPGGPNGTLLALDHATGQPVWRSAELTDDAAFTSLIAAEIGGVRQYVVLTDASVAGVAAADGKLLWRTARSGGLGTVATPLCRDNHVYVVSTPGAGCNLYRITASGGSFSVRQVYGNLGMLNDAGGVVLVGDYVYGYSERQGWVCQEFLTGRVVWTDNAFEGGSILYADGCFYLRRRGGTSASTPATVCLAQSAAQGFRQLARFDPPLRSDENAYPLPAIANGFLYLRDQDTMLCYRIKAE